MDYKIELLSPAGNFDALKAAVQNGANAVYLGGQKFNARKTAGNFSYEDLKKALYYCHVRDTKVHLAVNTLINDNELQEAEEFILQADQLGIDAVIIQDLGLASKIIGKISAQIHASTQMTIHNIAGAAQLKALGFDRAILARELSLDEIKEICEQNILDIEVFGHGALCISYSGQCLMSSFIGGRSGNRGTCAQPCRMKYGLLKDGTNITNTDIHLLSPADLCTLPYLQKLISTGIKSLKIEGRLKSPEYVALVTKKYRQAIDQIMENGKHDVYDNDVRDLAVMFSRGQFCSGNQLGKITGESMTYDKAGRSGIEAGIVVKYPKFIPAPVSLYDIEAQLKCTISKNDGITFFGDNEAGGMVNVIKISGEVVNSAKIGQLVSLRIAGEMPKDQIPLTFYKTYDSAITEQCRNTFIGEKEIRKVNITGHFTLQINNKPTFQVLDSDGNSAKFLSQSMSVIAINKPLDEQTILKQLNKTGDTPYNFTEITVDLGPGLILPLSALNEMRREALSQLTEMRSLRKKMPLNVLTEKLILPIVDTSHNDELDVSLFFYTEDEFMRCSDLDKGVTRVYIPLLALVSQKLKCFIEKLERNYEIYATMPVISKTHTLLLLDSLLRQAEILKLDGISATNIGDFKLIKEMKISGEISLNVFNADTGLYYKALGAETLVISPELTLEQMCNLANNRPIHGLEIIAYGRIPVMRSEYCPVGSILEHFTKNTKCNMTCNHGSKYALKDKVGDIFPVICDSIDCRSTIIDRKPIFLDNYSDVQKLRISGISGVRLNIYDESPDLINSLVHYFKSSIKGPLLNSIDGYKGHFYKGV